VKFSEHSCDNKNPHCRLQISIKGYYYDINLPEEKDFACIVFVADDMKSVYPNFKGPFQIKIVKRKINDRFIIETDKWINEQTELHNLEKKLDFFKRINIILSFSNKILKIQRLIRLLCIELQLGIVLVLNNSKWGRFLAPWFAMRVGCLSFLTIESAFLSLIFGLVNL